MAQNRQPPSNPPLIAGYRGLTLIAQGGFSSVYTAFQDRFSRTVAIKVLHADVRDPAAFEQFQHECAMTGRLTGTSHVITVFDAGVTADQRPYLAMQHLPNGSLADRLAALGPLPARAVLHVGVAIGGALAAAHRAGILHRDVKPANILVSADGEPVLSDFGIAGLAYAGTDRPAVHAFTVSHAAPEVLAGQPASIGSDIYSFGSTLYTLLAGSPPFGRIDGGVDGGNGGVDGDLSDDRIAQIRRGELAELDGLDLPPGAVALLRRTLAFEPGERPGSAAEVAEQCRAYRDDPRFATGVPGVPDTSAVPAAGSPPHFEQPTDLRWARPDAALPTTPVAGAMGDARVNRSTRPGPPGRRRLATAVAVVAALTAVVVTASVLTLHAMTSTGQATPTTPATAPTTMPITAPVRTTASSAAPVARLPGNTTSGVFYVSGGDAMLNAASGHGCKAWLNGRNPGPYAQALGQSWGDNCEMSLWRSTDGGVSYTQESRVHHIRSSTAKTDFYRNGQGYLAKACVTDHTTGQSACGHPFGG